MRALRQSLLGEADLSLAKAMDTAKGREAAERNAKSFKNQEVVVQKVVSSTKGAETWISCYRCGRPNHNAKDCRFREAECRFREAECHNCGKLGHIVPDCKSKSVKKFQRSRQAN